MRKKIDFTLNLIPLASGGWNFRLQAIGPGIMPGYFSPLSSYISRERTIQWARYHASIIVRQFSGTIGEFYIMADSENGQCRSKLNAVLI